MHKFRLNGLLVVALLAAAGPAGAQDNQDRIAAIMLDMEMRARNLHQSGALPQEPVVQVAAFKPLNPEAQESVIEEQAEGIPGYLLPEVYYPEVIADNPPVMSMQEIQLQPLGDRFIFSSAFQRRVNPPRGSYANIPDDCGCCDEWQTFMPCESCCRDLGLNPWVVQRARPNCPPHWWVHPNRTAECGDCNSGQSGGSCGAAKPQGLFSRTPW